MQDKIMMRLSLYASLLLFPLLLDGAIAYIPQTLKSCLEIVKNITNSSDNTNNLEDVYSVIMENRILASDSVMHKAIKEALCIADKNPNKFASTSQRKAVKKYLKRYLNSLNDKCILLTAHVDSNHTASWPSSLVMRSLEKEMNDCSASFDIMQLSNELVSSENIILCGDFGTNSTIKKCADNSTKAKKDPDVIFNANTMNNVSSSTPTIVFGTGVSSPVINAWIMSPSSSTQSPINIEFGIPTDLRTKKPVSLELHFLIKNQPSASGKARIQVNAKYMSQDDTFDIFATNPNFTATNKSSDFTISEPSSTDSLKHVYITMSLDNSAIKNGDLAFLSITRIAPKSGTEYMSDIYLAAATFKYTSK